MRAYRFWRTQKSKKKERKRKTKTTENKIEKLTLFLHFEFSKSVDGSIFGQHRIVYIYSLTLTAAIKWERAHRNIKIDTTYHVAKAEKVQIIFTNKLVATMCRQLLIVNILIFHHPKRRKQRKENEKRVKLIYYYYFSNCNCVARSTKHGTQRARQTLFCIDFLFVNKLIRNN